MKKDPFSGKRKIIPLRAPQKELLFEERVKKFSEYFGDPKQHGKIYSELGFSLVEDGCDGWCPGCEQKDVCTVYDHKEWGPVLKSMDKQKKPRKKGIAKILREHFDDYTRQGLLEEIIGLAERFSPVRDYYSEQVTVDGDGKVAAKYKKIIRNEFFPSRGFGKARLSVARKAVADYKKVAGSPRGIADIMLYYTEQGISFTNEYGDIDERFYAGMEKMYEDACQFIHKHNLKSLFEERCRKIVTDTDVIGWGFHDGLEDIYGEFFESDGE